MKFPVLSEPTQRAVRLSVAVLVACLIGYGLILPNQGIHTTHKKSFSTGLKWSSITCIVVSSPVIGRAAQTGTERIVGTVAGGLLGFGVFYVGSNYWDTFSDGVVLSIGAAIVAFTSITIGAAFNLENSTKLYALTFMLVTFGSENLASKSGALELTLTRIGGICFGVLLSEITSVLIFPKSATQEAILLLRKSLDNLTELNAIAWQHGPLFRPEWRSLLPGQGNASVESWWNSKRHLLDTAEWQGDEAERESRFEEECEKVLMQTYTQLTKVVDYLPQARSEVYAGHLRGRLCFLPGIPWLQLGRRVLPEAEIQALATNIRRVARLLWAVHLSFQDGFDKNMVEMLQQQYPQQLMPDLAQQIQGCLQDMVDAFPNSERVPRGHINSLVSAVETLLRISDFQRRRVLHHMKRSRTRRGSPKSSQGTSPRRVPAGNRMSLASRTSALSPAASGQLPRDYALGRSKSRRVEGLPQSAGAPQTALPKEGATLAAADGAGGDLEAPLLSESPEEEAALSVEGSPAPSSRAPVAAAYPSLASTAYCGSPGEVFRNLPDGLHINVGSPTDGESNHSYKLDVDEGDERRSVSIRLQRVKSGELIVFPETAEGYVDKVRWYSFQFLMEELTEEIEEMYVVLNKLLAILPRPCLI